MKLLIKLLTISLMCLVSTTMVYADVEEDESTLISDLDLDQEIRWLQAEAYVLTASKKVEPIDRAPSVMTVFTAEDIRRQGLRNINEILDRTVGFFTSRNMSNVLISNRGIASNENEPFLLLIDGHNMNSIVDKGAGDYFLFPLITHAKQVEIVRGPGSTLWGSDASLGVIHVITKDGKDIDGFQTTVDYASEDNYRYTNVMYGKGWDDNDDVMFSFTYAESDGFPEDGYESYEAVWGPVQRGPIDKINDSWEFYGKMQQKDFRFIARASDLMNLNMDRTRYWEADPALTPYDYAEFMDYYNRRRHYMLSMDHTKEFNKIYTLETKVFTDLLECWQGTANPNISSDLKYVDEFFSSKESRLGMELMLKADFNEKHHLLAGFQGVRTEVDPVFYRVVQTTNSIDPLIVYEDVALLVKPYKEDLNLATYVEDNWLLSDDINLIFGLRIDHNNLREDSFKFLPRAALIYSLSPNWTTKYLYNTGYVRPPVAKSLLSQEPVMETTELDENWNYISAPHIGSTESEEVATHDLQLIFNNQRLRTSITGYHTVFKNAFNFAGVSGYVDDVLYYLLYVNSNTITSDGIEFDVRLNIIDQMDIYGNYSHVIQSKIDEFENTANGIDYTMENIHLFTDDRTLTKFPHKIWNLGIDVFPMENVSLNLHYRGWMETWTELVEEPGEYEKLGPEHFVDATLCFTKLPGNTTATIYAKNLLNNDDARYPMLFSDGWYARGCSVGGKVTLNF